MKTLRVNFLKSYIKTSIGLIGQEKAKPIMFYTRFGIHTFFLKFPIDVIILDKNNVVVKLVNNLKPNRIFVWNPKFYKVVELPSGFIKKKKIKFSDKIAFIYGK